MENKPNTTNNPVKDRFTSSVVKPEPAPAAAAKTTSPAPESVKPEIITAVKKVRCKVLSYNRYSNILVYERDGDHIQTNAIHDYDGSGFVEVE